MEFKKNFSLQNLNSLSLHSSARRYCCIESIEDLLEASDYARSINLPIFPLGGGTNIVLPRKLDYLVVKNNLIGKKIVSNKVLISSGENWHHSVLWTLQNKLYGLENLSLIPGTVGASPVQNIGAYGVELSSKLISVNAIDLSNSNSLLLTNEDCCFGYRDSIFKRNKQLFITDINLQLDTKDSPTTSYSNLNSYLLKNNIDPSLASSMEVCMAVISLRSSLLPDPLSTPNVGSFFKNPIVGKKMLKELLKINENIPFFKEGKQYKISAGYLLEQEGWKGYESNGVSISKKHSLVLITDSGVSINKITDLVKKIKENVLKKYKLSLEVEPEFIL